jgi:hypothetical protein
MADDSLSDPARERKPLGESSPGHAESNYFARRKFACDPASLEDVKEREPGRARSSLPEAAGECSLRPRRLQGENAARRWGELKSISPGRKNVACALGILTLNGAVATEKFTRSPPIRKRLGLLWTHCAQQVADGEQRRTDKCAGQIDVMPNTVLSSPTHRGKQVQCFSNMGKHNHDEASSSDHLQQRVWIPCSNEQDC